MKIVDMDVKYILFIMCKIFCDIDV